MNSFRIGYLQELDARIARSELVGTGTQGSNRAVLFYDRNSGEFALLEQTSDSEEVSVFDAVTRHQWGRTVMVFGHKTGRADGYVASGHGAMEGGVFVVKFANKHQYRIKVNSQLPYLTPFANGDCAPRSKSKPFPQKPKNRASSHALHDSQRILPVRDERPAEDEEDLTEEDLRRLRGHLPLHERGRI